MAEGMHMAFFGASLVSGYENGAATYCRGLLRALAKRGHVIRFYEPVAPERLAHRDILDPPWAEIVRFDADGEGLEAALEHAADADVLVKISGSGMFDDLLDAAVPHCTVPPALSVYWDLQPAATLQRLRADPDSPLRAQFSWYDVVLMRYGGDAVIEAFQRWGARTCFPMYAAVDPEVHYPVPAAAEYAATLVLLAHRTDGAEAQVQHGFFDVAAALPARRFVLGGCGWDGVPMPANVRYAGYVYTAEHNWYYSAAAAVRNLTPAAAAALGHAPTSRLFEAAGAGACVISDGWAGLETFFEPAREILIAREPRAAIEQLNGLGLERAAAIGRRARERCRAEHTYDRRAVELEALLQGFDRQWVNKTAL